MELEITDRVRKYGYIFWRRRQDHEMLKLLGNLERVRLHFQNNDCGEKRVDWRYRRISVGAVRIQKLPDDVTLLVLSIKKPGQLIVKCI